MTETTKDTIKVRQAHSGDEAALADLNQRFNGVKIPVADILKSIKSKSTELVFVAEIDGRIGGFACVQIVSSFANKRKTAELTDIFVEEVSRRKGVGSMMMLVLRKYCEKQDIAEFFLRVNRSNKRAIAFYESHGLLESEHREFVIRYG